MATNVSILAEIPEDLHLSMQGYLDGNPSWDQDRVFSAAISLFLLQNTVESSPEASLNYRRAARVYLDTLFAPELGITVAEPDASAESCAFSTEERSDSETEVRPDACSETDSEAETAQTSASLPSALIAKAQVVPEVIEPITDLIAPADNLDAA